MSWDELYLHLYEHTRIYGLKSMLNLIEEGMIAKALAEAKANCSDASKILQISRTLLVEKRRKYGFPLHNRNGWHVPETMRESEEVPVPEPAGE